MRKILVLALVLCMVGCSSPKDAQKALEGAGYTEVRITGYRFFGCSKDDAFSTGFTAKGPTGKEVSGVVCSDWFKGSTIRTD